MLLKRRINETANFRRLCSNAEFLSKDKVVEKKSIKKRKKETLKKI
jgi:hypothetical protein